MNKIKFIKAAITPFAIIGGVSLCTSAITSCGKKSTPPPKATWNQFLAKAEAETLSNIVYNAYPSAGNWKNLPNSDLSKDGDFKVTNHRLEIIIKSISKQGSASFSITAPDDNVYSVDDWTCFKQPPPPPSEQWNTFKTAAKAVSAEALLLQVKKMPNIWDSFFWIGNTDQQKWKDNALAEFDIYGGAGGSDPYKGMAGKPIIDASHRTITAIISIQGKNGTFDSDPIKVVITDQGLDYNIKNWIFSQDQQLQSQARYTKAFSLAIGNFPNSGNMNDKNSIWTHFGYGNFVSNNGSNHTETNSIIGYLNINGLDNDTLKQILWKTYTTLAPTGNRNTLTTTILIHLWASLDPLRDFSLTLTNNFVLNNVDNDNVGSAFNENWHVVLKALHK